MTFQEALELIRHHPAYILGRDEVKLALAEQIEANRVAINAMMLHVHWQDVPMGLGTTGPPVFNEQALTPKPASDNNSGA